jgi:hypothetical protein
VPRELSRASLAAAAALAAFAVAGHGAAALSPGVYQTTIRGASPAVLNATWRLSFTGFAFAIDRNGRPAVQGLVTRSRNRIVFEDVAGPFRCLRGQAKGTYTWTLKRGTLRLTALTDRCAGRRTVLSRPFRRTTR